MGRPEYWTENKVREISRDYDFISDMAEDHPGAYAAIKQRYRHLKNELFPVFKKLVWTEEKLHEEAAKYETRNEFRSTALGAYSRACQIGVLDDICGHMRNNRLKGGRLDLAKYEGVAGLYFLYSGDELIYIGKSEYCVVNRVRDHYKDKDFDSLEIYPMRNHADILVVEAYLIAAHKPKFNDMGVTEFQATVEISNLEDVIGEPIVVGVNGMNSFKGH